MPHKVMLTYRMLKLIFLEKFVLTYCICVLDFVCSF